jgi:ABC-2 type transport system permease protein
MRVLRSELFKLRTTPGAWVVLGVTLLLTALGIITAFVVSTGATARFAAPTTARTPVHAMRNLMGAGYGAGTVMAPVLGVLCITTEYRQKLLSSTLLVTPQRQTVLVAKTVASMIWGLFLGVAGLVLVAAMGIPLLVSEGGSVSLLLHQIGPVVPGLLGAYVLLAVFGLGVGTLLRNQIAAVVVTIVVVIVLEPILVALVHSLAHYDLNWLPSRSTAALAGGLTRNGKSVTPEGSLLTWWTGGLVLLLWGVGTAVIGYFTTFQRDVT